MSFSEFVSPTEHYGKQAIFRMNRRQEVSVEMPNQDAFHPQIGRPKASQRAVIKAERERRLIQLQPNSKASADLMHRMYSQGSIDITVRQNKFISQLPSFNVTEK